MPAPSLVAIAIHHVNPRLYFRKKFDSFFVRLEQDIGDGSYLAKRYSGEEDTEV